MIRTLTAAALLMAVATSGADAPSVGLSFVIPSRDGAARVSVDDPAAHFHVVLQNLSDVPVRIWDDTFSWGYYTVSFELLDGSGAHRMVRRKKIEFTRNIPASWLLAPQGLFVFDVYLADTSVWEDVPVVSSDCLRAKARAIYEVQPDVESERQNVWTGRAVSAFREVSLCR